MKPFVNEYLKGIIILLSLLSTISGHELVKRQADSQKKVVCYYANWSVYRQGVAKFTPQNINPYLCTHLIYAFGGLSKDDTVQPFDKYQDIEKNGYSKFAALKTYNKDLKTMLAIGGWNEGSKRFSPMVADPKRRNTFIRSAIGFLRRYNFDGIDLDWEYPTQRDGGKPEDKENYAIFIREMRNVFEDEAEKTGNDRLIISMAVPASLEYTAEGFDLENLDQDLDFFNILAYDYHSSYEPFVNHHSALFRTKAISEFDHRKDLNIDSTVKFYLKNGASREKIVLGIPTYGRSFTLINPDAHEIGSPSDGPGRQGEGTKEDGYLAYYEICNGIKDEKWEVVNPSPGETGPYAHKDTLWVGYDDEDIASEKAYYVAEEGLGGIMFWTIDNDDFRGKCHKKSFPLIEAAKKALYSSTSSVKTKTSVSVSTSEQIERLRLNGLQLAKIDRKHSNTVQSPPQSFTDRPRSLNSNFDPFHTPEPPTTPSSEPAFVCKDEGFFPHSKSCKKYYWCLEAAGVGMVAHTFTCPQGLFFNPLTDGCDFKRNVDCGEKSQKEEVQIQSTTTLSPKTDDESGNEKSLQEILSDIKSAGGLEAFEEQLEEEEKSKLALRQRTKDRNTNISSKTRNRFTKLLERKNPKDSKPKDDETSGSSNGNKRPGGNSFLSRLAQRRRNKNPSSSSTSSVSTTETSTKPPTSISPPSEKPTRPGFLRNRKRPSLLRKRPSITNNKQNEKETEETNVVLETSSARPRSPLLRNRFRNANRGRQTTTSESPFIEEEPEEIKSTSRPTSFRPESRNRFRTAVQKDTDTAELDEDINNNIRNEEAPSFRARSRTPERKFRLPSVQNRGLPPRLTNSTSSIDTSRNLAYVNIDRSRGRPELSRTEPPLTPKAVTTEETPSDREGTVRDLEYVTIQRGGPSLLNEQVGFGIYNEILSLSGKHPKKSRRRLVRAASDKVSVVFPSSPYYELPPLPPHEGVAYIYPNLKREHRQVSSSQSTTTVDSLSNNEENAVHQEIITAKILPSPFGVDDSPPIYDFYDDDDIVNVSVSKSISETLNFPKGYDYYFNTLFNEDEEDSSIEKSTRNVAFKLANSSVGQKTATSTLVTTTTIPTTVTTTTTTTTTATTTTLTTTTTITTTTTPNKIQSLINLRKKAKKNSLLLSKNRKVLDSFNEVNNVRKTLITTTSSSTTTKRSGFSRSSFKRPGYRSKSIGRPSIVAEIEITTTATIETTIPLTTTTERNLVKNLNRGTNSFFSKLRSRATKGTTTTTTPSSSPYEDRIKLRTSSRPFIPTRPNLYRSPLTQKPVDLSASPSRKSLSNERSSQRKNKFTEPTTTIAPHVSEETTQKLTVGEILANLHGEPTEEPKASTLRPKSFKPKFQRNKLREKLRDKLKEDNEFITTLEPESQPTTTLSPRGGSSSSNLRLRNKITPRRKFTRPSSIASKSPRTTLASRFKPTPRRSFKKTDSQLLPTAFAPTRPRSVNRSPSSRARFPFLASTAPLTTRYTTEPTTNIFSDQGIKQKLGLIPTPVPYSFDEEELYNDPESTIFPSIHTTENILLGLFGSNDDRDLSIKEATEKNSVQNFLKSAIVSSSIADSSHKNTVSQTTTERFRPFAPQAFPTVASLNERQPGTTEEEDFSNIIAEPPIRGLSLFATRRPTGRLRGRGRKLRRKTENSASKQVFAPTTPLSIESEQSFQLSSRKNLPGRAQKVRNFHVPTTRRKIFRNRLRSREETDAPILETTTLPTINEIDEIPERRKPDLQRRRNLGKFSSIRNTTDTDSDDADLDKQDKSVDDIIIHGITAPSTENLSTPTEESATTQSLLTSTSEEIIDEETTTESRTIVSSTTAKSQIESVPPSLFKSSTRRIRSRLSRLRKKPSSSSETVNTTAKKLLNATTILEAVVESSISSLEREPRRKFPDNVSTGLILNNRIERRSTLSNFLKRVDSTDISVNSINDTNVTESRFSAVPISTTSSRSTKSFLFSKKRPNFFRSRTNPLIKSNSRESSSLFKNARERTDEDIEDLGEVSTTTIRDEIETTPPVPSSTSTSPTTTSVTTSSTTRSTTRRSLFRSFRRPKNPLFKRKKSPSKTPSLLATTATTTNLSSSSSSTSSSSTSPIITTATTPASTTSVPSSLSKSSSLFSRNQQSRKNRFSFKLNKIRRKPGSLKKSSAFVGNSEAEKKTSRNETKKEVTHQREPEDESVEGGGFLAGRLRQRLQKQRIKSSSSFVPPRSSLILLKKPTDSVPTTTTTTSTATTETAFFPTVADPEEEVYATIQTTTITTTTTTTTTTVYTTTTTTTTSTTASTPATTIPIIETTNFSSPTIPLPFVTTIPTPRPKTTIISSTPTQRAENPFISSTPTQRAENPFISSTISAEEEASLISSTPYPRRQLPFFSSTPSQRRKTILSTKPGPRRQTHFLSSTTTAPTPTTFRGRFPERPRRLNVFRNRFQGSPSSPRPFVSKSREEELFSEIQEQKTPRPLNQVPPPRRKESRARVSPSPFTTPAPRLTTFATTTTPANTEPTSIISSPPRRFPPTRQRKPSRFRNTVSRPVHRRKPTTTTTTTPSFREYDYYTDDEYSVDENNVQNLKSVDPVYDYDLVPLSNKVTMSPEGPVCHDVGVFPHPISCKKFVTCSRRTARGRIDGWEYECPIYLAFDPIGGRCNWAADVDCH